MLSGVNEFGGVDERPDEVFEAFAPFGGELVSGRGTGACGFDFLAPDVVGDGVEVVIPGDVLRGAGFLFGRRWLGVSTANIVMRKEVGEVGFFFGGGGFSREEAEEEFVEEFFGVLISEGEAGEGVVVAEAGEPDPDGAI